MAEKEIMQDLHHRPSYIFCNPNGSFTTVQKIGKEEDGTYVAQCVDINQELMIGRDMREVPMRGLTLCCLVENGEDYGKRTINELRKFGQIAGFDYVAFEGNNIGMLITPRNESSGIYQITPRAFVKIVDS